MSDLDDAEPQLPLREFAKTPLAIAALASALLPFFVHFTSSSTRTTNGVVVADFFRDYPAIGGGGLAVVLGLVLLASKSAAMGVKGPLAGLCVVLGAYHLFHGFGLDRPKPVPEAEAAARVLLPRAGQRPAPSQTPS